MAVVVSDTSPIRALAQLDLLHLPAALYERVIIPPAVVRELETVVPGLRTLDLKQVPSLSIQAPLHFQANDLWARPLGPGEQEAIALALEIHPQALLIDEAKGRKIALALGLKPLGMLGLLAQARRNGLVASVAPLMDRLQLKLNFESRLP